MAAFASRAPIQPSVLKTASADGDVDSITQSLRLRSESSQTRRSDLRTRS